MTFAICELNVLLGDDFLLILHFEVMLHANCRHDPIENPVKATLDSQGCLNDHTFGASFAQSSTSMSPMLVLSSTYETNTSEIYKNSITLHAQGTFAVLKPRIACQGRRITKGFHWSCRN